jgi:hypothetical protein
MRISAKLKSCAKVLSRCYPSKVIGLYYNLHCMICCLLISWKTKKETHCTKEKGYGRE